MLNNKTFLAIIPARGGSKRLPRKNILDLCGKPLIGWSIEAGFKSKYIDKVVVTSDDDKIIEISENFGAKTIKRPDELASDTATTFEVVEHTIENQEKNYDYIIILQPTSPLRTSTHIDEAIELLFRKNGDAIISVCEVEHSPLWTNTLPEDGNMSHFVPKKVQQRSQDLEQYYRLNGAIYICNTKKYLEKKTAFIKDSIYSYIMPQWSSVDIDTKLDFLIANQILKGYDE